MAYYMYIGGTIAWGSSSSIKHMSYYSQKILALPFLQPHIHILVNVWLLWSHYVQYSSSTITLKILLDNVLKLWSKPSQQELQCMQSYHAVKSINHYLVLCTNIEHFYSKTYFICCFRNRIFNIFVSGLNRRSSHFRMTKQCLIRVQNQVDYTTLWCY